MLGSNVWRRIVGVDRHVVIEDVEIEGEDDLSSWLQGTRAIARREVAHPGAQLTFTDVDGRRYQVFLTDHLSQDIAFLEGLYRGRGRAECAIRDTKDSGLSNLPSASLALNAAWLHLVLIAGPVGLGEGTAVLRRVPPRGTEKAPLLPVAQRGRHRLLGPATNPPPRRELAVVGGTCHRVLAPRALIDLSPSPSQSAPWHRGGRTRP